jgi:hypothetical protein
MLLILTEEMKGVDSLLDLVDHLDLVDQDLTSLDDVDDADTWSQPASSVFGDDILNDSLLL